jgi:hypothetical protein
MFALASTLSAQQVELVVTGTAQEFAWSVDGAGDVDGDGYPDLIVGVQNSSQIGFVELYSGRNGALIRRHHGVHSRDEFGSSVAGDGDLDGDGVSDYVVGGRSASVGALASGIVRAYSGIDGSTLYTWAGGFSEQLGWSVDIAGDVNGDGHDDVVAGAFTANGNGAESGAAYVFSGRDGSILHLVHGDSANDWLGTSVSAAGDVNADGLADFIVGAPGDDNVGGGSGSARVYSGSNGGILFHLDGDVAGELFGVSVCELGDVDGDDHADFAVGSRNGSANVGSIKVFSGRTGARLYTSNGNAPGSWFGLKLDGAGDVDGDGWPDLVTGSYRDGQGVFYAGGAHVISGRDGSRVFSYYGAQTQNYLGWSVGGVGDIDGDGYAEVVIGTMHDGHQPGSPGSATVLGRSHANGTAICLGQPNSTLARAPLQAIGSLVALDNALVLSVRNLPVGTTALMLNARAFGVQLHPAILGQPSDGNLCLGATGQPGGGIGRYPAPFSGPGTTFQLPLDLTAVPRPNGTQSVMAGETWLWQCWYRDVGAAGRSNFSDAVQISFL